MRFLSWLELMLLVGFDVDRNPSHIGLFFSVSFVVSFCSFHMHCVPCGMLHIQCVTLCSDYRGYPWNVNIMQHSVVNSSVTTVKFSLPNPIHYATSKHCASVTCELIATEIRQL